MTSLFYFAAIVTDTRFILRNTSCYCDHINSPMLGSWKTSVNRMSTPTPKQFSQDTTKLDDLILPTYNGGLYFKILEEHENI